MILTKKQTARLRVGALLVAFAWLTACTLTPPGYSLQQSGGRYRLNRPFEDYYDTALVLTDGGRSAAPRVLTLGQAAQTLSRDDVVFFGENHTHPGVHLEQMKLLRTLVDRDPHWILSFEQFERDVQGVIDEYLAGRIGENQFIDKSRAWNNYAASYRPLLIFAREHHLPVVAAEAPGWTISCVGQWGPGILARFTPEERSWVARDVNPAAGPYRDKFMAFLGGNPSHGGGAAGSPEAAARAERSFTAQVTRDDTMAESIARARSEHPGYKVLHLTGSFHVAGFLGTVEQLQRLDPQLKIGVIDPVEVDDPHAPAFAADIVRDATVLELIYPNPDEFVDGEDMKGFIAKMKHEREANRCKYSPTDAVETPSASH